MLGQQPNKEEKTFDCDHPAILPIAFIGLTALGAWLMTKSDENTKLLGHITLGVAAFALLRALLLNKEAVKKLYDSCRRGQNGYTEISDENGSPASQASQVSQ